MYNNLFSGTRPYSYYYVWMKKKICFGQCITTVWGSLNSLNQIIQYYRIHNNIIITHPLVGPNSYFTLCIITLRPIVMNHIVTHRRFCIVFSKTFHHMGIDQLWDFDGGIKLWCSNFLFSLHGRAWCII